MSFIYKITNLVNGTIYVGQTKKSLKTRFYQHIRCSLIGEHNYPLNRAIVKYGKDNFIIEPLEECEDELLNQREIYWIKFLNSRAPNGYNVAPGGAALGKKEDHFRWGTKFSEELKKKLSEAHKRRYQNPREITRRKKEVAEQMLRPEMHRKMQKSRKCFKIKCTILNSGVSFCCYSLEDLSLILNKRSGNLSKILSGKVRSFKYKIERIS